MTRLVWGDLTSRLYNVGVDRGVYFGTDGLGKPWNGLVSVVETSDGESDSHIYLDGVKLVNRKRFGDFAASIEAFSYPAELDSRPKVTFGFAYRVMVDDYYQLHIVYNAKAILADTDFRAVSDNMDLVPFKLDVTTLPLTVDTNRRTSHLVIDTRNQDVIFAIEALLYGDDTINSYLPTPDEVLEIFEAHATIRVTDNHDGTFTISGPDDLVYWTDATSWVVDSPAVIFTGPDSYNVRSS